MNYFEKMMQDKSISDAKEMDAINDRIEKARRRLTQTCKDCARLKDGCYYHGVVKDKIGDCKNFVDTIPWWKFWIAKP